MNSPTVAHTGIPERILDAVRNAVCGDERVARVILFGSRAKGNWRDGSDIDIAIVGRNLNAEDVWRWGELLDDDTFPWSVDIVLISDQTDAALVEHVERVGIELCGAAPAGT
ncbi:MAG: nucleotidyltransferase domain-containing protein [Spirochaeta sp.]|jgi:predicted nucleotidyltransferase|nr:nucleotidyltransferase domain-containing protein [Spirochaeta sp.]